MGAGTAPLDYEKRAGILIDAVVVTPWFDTFRMVSDRILQLPDFLASTLMAETDPERMTAILHAARLGIPQDTENSQT